MKLSTPRIVFVFLVVTVVCMSAWSDGVSPEVDYIGEGNITSYIYRAPSIRPVGWSKDGKYAYMERSVDNERGNIYIWYNIMDAVTDEKLESSTDDANWQTLLDKYGIDTTHNMEFLLFPVEIDGSVYQPEFDIQINNVDGPAAGSIFGFTVYMKKDEKSKKIFSISSEDYDYLACWSEGFFLSPFEKRIVVVIGTESRGWKGTSDIFFWLAGSHLSFGF